MAEISQQLLNAQKELMKRRALDGVSYRPPTPEAQKTGVPAPSPKPDQTTPKAPETVVILPEAVKVHPTLAHAFTDGRAAVGRIWYLLKAYDLEATDGGGVVDVAAARELFTGGGAWSHITWRRLRQIFAQGEGVTWERDRNGRLHLRGLAAVSAALGVERLKGAPVLVEAGELVKGAKATNAQFYAAHLAAVDNGKPRARATLQAITGASPNSQRAYEKLAGVEAKENISVSGVKYTQAAAQAAAWKHGKVFRFTDKYGKQPHLKAGESVIAWQLPNSYSAPNERASGWRQRKANRQISNLVNKSARGDAGKLVKRYFDDQGQAIKEASRDVDNYHYYKTTGTITPKAARQSKLTAAQVYAYLPAYGRVR